MNERIAVVSGGRSHTYGQLEEASRRVARILHGAGVSFGILYDADVRKNDGKYQKLTPELYGAIIDEAHRRGLRVTAHIFALDDAKGDGHDRRGSTAA